MVPEASIRDAAIRGSTVALEVKASGDIGQRAITLLRTVGLIHNRLYWLAQQASDILKWHAKSVSASDAASIVKSCS
jgi:hypothetical protein